MADGDLFGGFDPQQLTTGLGGTGVPADWAPQPAQVTVNPDSDPGAAYAYAPQDGNDDGTNAVAGATGAPMARGGGLGGGLFSGLTSLFGSGTNAAPGPAAGTPGAAPGWQQGAIGLGLGLLGGNVFNKWGPALRGYQTGAAADVARQAQVNQWANQQAQLAISRGHLGIAGQELALRRELANRPQVQFRQNEDTGEWDALQYDPVRGTVRSLPIQQADKLAEQAGVNATYYDPIKQQNLPYPPGVNKREFRRDMAKVQSDLVAGKVNAWQLAQQFYYKYFGGGAPLAAQAPAGTYRSRPSGVPPGSQYSPSRKQWRDRSGRLYNDQGQPVQ